MATQRAKVTTVQEYIELFPPDVREVLESVRAVIRNVIPEAKETISYQIPTFVLDGPVVHFAAFKKHIGMYPPVRGDAKLEAAVEKYANEKGNLAFPLDEPMPLRLIERIVKFQVRQNAARAAEKKPRKHRPTAK
jgi:uncharacterized protein YdhG (YjbR/CyaY superfamily)